MRYAIVINMDYDNQSPEVCSEIWHIIKDKMIAVGFLANGRNFTINKSEQEACELARAVIEGIEEHLEYHNKRIYRYLKEFYGFNMADTINLMLPSMDGISVEE